MRDLMASPFGALLLHPWVDRRLLRALRTTYFPLSRAWAAAQVAGRSEERFAAEIGDRPRPRGLVRSALAQIHRRSQALAEADARWEEVVFGEKGRRTPNWRLATAERRRLEAAHALSMARSAMIPPHLARRFPPLRRQVAPPGAVDTRHGPRLDPGKAFPAPGIGPVSMSHPVPWEHGTTRWLRTPSPVADAGTAWARVYLPGGDGRQPSGTVILGQGISVETEFVRGLSEPPDALTRAGLAVLRPEAPFHGRRRSAGTYAGEPIMGNVPMGMLDFLWAHVLELGLWVAWARRTVGGPVALAGFSLGALTIQRLLTAAADWPSEMWPDAALLITASGAMDAVAHDGALAQTLGVPEAMRDAGWTPDMLTPWLPLMEPRGRPILPPDRIAMVLGAEDEVLPYRHGNDLAEGWRVPAANLFVRPLGHFTVIADLLRDAEPLERLVAILRGG